MSFTWTLAILPSFSRTSLLLQYTPKEWELSGGIHDKNGFVLV
jgi:hypothetical protein